IRARAVQIASPAALRDAARSSADLLSLADLRFLECDRAVGTDILALLPHDEADQEGSGGEELFRRSDAVAGLVRRDRQDRRIVRRQDSAHPWRAGAERVRKRRCTLGGDRKQASFGFRSFPRRRESDRKSEARGRLPGSPPSWGPAENSIQSRGQVLF